MRKIVILLLSLTLFAACDNQDSHPFGITMPESNITFEPIAGGALMHYHFPDNSDVFGLQVKYTDCQGKKIAMTGTYASTVLSLKGFIEAETNIPVEISLLDASNNPSNPITMTFSTQPSAARAIFDNIKVSPYWAGFRVQYTAIQGADGFINIGRIGISPTTGQVDTLLLKTEIIQPGENTINFPNTVSDDNTTSVVVWTEDYRGYDVLKKVYAQIEGIQTGVMDPTNFIFEGASMENSVYCIGSKYLFDGDTKGVQRITKGQVYGFWGPEYCVPGFWTLDLGEAKTLSMARIYCPLNVPKNIFNYPFDLYDYYPYSYIPNHVIISGSSDKNEWVKLGEFYQSLDVIDAERWSYPFYNKGALYSTAADLEKADPAYMEIQFELSESQYRYLKIDILHVFGEDFTYMEKKVYIQELEIYVKK